MLKQPTQIINKVSEFSDSCSMLNLLKICKRMYMCRDTISWNIMTLTDNIPKNAKKIRIDKLYNGNYNEL